MEVKVNSPKPWLRELEVELEPELLKAEVARTLDEYLPRAELPGFRKGHVPRAVFERRMGDSLEQSAMQELVERTAAEVLARQGLRPAAEPEVPELELRPDKSIRFKIVIEVIPEFELGEYKGIAVDRREPSGFDEEFERRLRQLQERCATYRSVPGPAVPGQFVVADWRMFDGDKEVGKPRTNLMLELGDEQNFKEVNEGLAGVTAGTERSVEVGFPDDYADKELAGRRLALRFEVREVKEKQVPPVDEDLALALGFDSLDELRKEMNEGILADRARLIASDMKNQLFEQVLKLHEFEPPDSWVKYNYERLCREFEEPKDDETKARVTAIAARRARFDIVAARIAEAEGIGVSDEEVEDAVRALAEGMKRPVEELASVKDSQVLRSRLLNDKVMEFLLENAHIRGTLLGADGRPVSSGETPSEPAGSAREKIT
ncbi:MAG TPA: trigger factor [candidate division WOR-3 bacterium]|uniref:Trigger factor n=1 Tax=candidate division WOR-3 bacterium TaxID=2052148 RepID=A0A7V0XFY7_UNCW3|nr:trigger factor [candidate division WOR-3 bacterium]